MTLDSTLGDEKNLLVASVAQEALIRRLRTAASDAELG